MNLEKTDPFQQVRHRTAVPPHSQRHEHLSEVKPLYSPLAPLSNLKVNIVAWFSQCPLTERAGLHLQFFRGKKNQSKTPSPDLHCRVINDLVPAAPADLSTASISSEPWGCRGWGQAYGKDQTPKAY